MFVRYLVFRKHRSGWTGGQIVINVIFPFFLLVSPTSKYFLERHESLRPRDLNLNETLILEIGGTTITLGV